MFRLHIQNFQSIADLEIRLQGFTALVGKSNRGKSAIIRALRAVLCNEWNSGYLKAGAQECQITFEILEKTEYLKSLFPDLRIQKIQLKKPVNEYKVWLEDGTVLTYPKVGKAVPEIFAELNLGEIVTERDDKYNLCFQSQLDPLFLLTRTDVELSSFLNKVFDISRFEKALREMSSDDIKMSRESGDLEANLPGLEIELKNCDDLITKSGDLILELESGIEGVETCEQKFNTMSQDYRELAEQESVKQEINQKIIDTRIAKLCLQTLSVLRGQVSGLKELRGLQGNHKDLGIGLKQGKDKLTSIQAMHSNLSKIKQFVLQLKQIRDLQEVSESIKTQGARKLGLGLVANVLSTYSKIGQEIKGCVADVLTLKKENQSIEKISSTLGIYKKVRDYLQQKTVDVWKQIEFCPVCKHQTCEVGHEN